MNKKGYEKIVMCVSSFLILACCGLLYLDSVNTFKDLSRSILRDSCTAMSSSGGSVLVFEYLQSNIIFFTAILVFLIIQVIVQSGRSKRNSRNINKIMVGVKLIFLILMIGIFADLILKQNSPFVQNIDCVTTYNHNLLIFFLSPYITIPLGLINLGLDIFTIDTTI